MNLAAPFGLAAAALALPLVAWYVLRVRRPQVTVASTFLWQQRERSVAAAVPWQRFRSDATFWLVLLALLLGALALAQPFVRVQAALGDHTVLVMDASASMLADEEGPSRLELARRQAEGLVDRLAPGQVMSVVEAGTRGRVLLSSSGDQRAIARALASVRLSHGPANLADAFTLVAALERPGQQTVVHLLTDGVLPPDAQDAAPEGLVITAVGVDRPNLAITRLQAVPVGAGANQVFVQVRNFGALPTKARLTLSVGGETVDEQLLELGPRASEDLLLDVEGGAGDVLQAEIAPTGRNVTGDENSDALGVDDAAYALLASPRDVAVLIVGEENVFLAAAFAAVPGVTVTTAATVPTDLEEVDLLVIDRGAAPAAPTVPTLYIAPSSPPAGITSGSSTERPTVAFQSPEHELLAQVDLSETAIAVAQVVEAAALETVVGGPDGPMVLAGRLDGMPVVYIAFDLLASNLPLQAAWPVFVANAVSWLAGPPTSQPATAGATVSIPVPLGSAGARVAPPSGAAIRLDPAAPRVDVDQVGLWRVTYEAAGEAPAPPAFTLAVNPAPDEGDLARPHPVAEEEPDPEAQRRAAGAAEGRRAFGRWLLVGVLVIAVMEWLWAMLLRPRWATRRGRRGGTPLRRRLLPRGRARTGEVT